MVSAAASEASTETEYVAPADVIVGGAELPLDLFQSPRGFVDVSLLKENPDFQYANHGTLLGQPTAGSQFGRVPGIGGGSFVHSLVAIAAPQAIVGNHQHATIGNFLFGGDDQTKVDDGIVELPAMHTGDSP